MKTFTFLITFLLSFVVLHSQDLKLVDSYKMDARTVQYNAQSNGVIDIGFNYDHNIEVDGTEFELLDGFDAAFISTDGQNTNAVLDFKNAFTTSIVDLEEKVNSDDGGYILGSFSEELNVNPLGDEFLINASQSTRYFLLEHDENGLLNWVSQFNITSLDSYKISSIGSDLYLTGVFQDSLAYVSPSGAVTEFIADYEMIAIYLKIDGNGEIVWSNLFELGPVPIFPAKSVQKNNKIYAIWGDIWISMVKTFEDSGAELDSIGFAGINIKYLDINDQGDIYMTGNFLADNSVNFGVNEDSFVEGIDAFDGFLVKYDSSWNLQWLRTFEGQNIDTGVQFTFGNGSIYLTGCIQTNATFADDNGNQVFYANGFEDVFIAKYAESDGAIQWVTAYGGNLSDVGLAISYDEGEIVVAGRFMEAMDVDLADDSELILVGENPNSNTSYFVSRYIDCQELDCTPTSIDPVFENSIKVYPSITSSIINIESSEIQNYSVQLWAMDGTKLFESNNSVEFDISHLKPGIYILKIQDINSLNYISERIIKH